MTVYDWVGCNHGSIHGAKRTGDGQVKGALIFDGDNDYVDIGDIGIVGNWTVSFWARSSDNAGVIYYPIGLEAPGKGIIMGGTYLAVRQLISIYDGVCIMHGATVVQTGVWYHIAITKSETNYSIYVNGIKEKAGSLNDIDLTDFKIGTRPDMFGCFNGAIDDVGIWDCVLAVGDIEDPDPRTINYVRLNGVSGPRYGTARNPSPCNGLTDVATDVVLVWRPGDQAADANGHNVYFGTDFDDVKDANPIRLLGDVNSDGRVNLADMSELAERWLWKLGGLELCADLDGDDDVDLIDFAIVANDWMECTAYKGRQDINSYDVCGLGFETTYYWRVDEVNNVDVWIGNVWGFTTKVDGALPTLTNAPIYQTTPTYDGSGQAIHPDIVYFSDGWNGYKYWMAMTPYPYSNARKENPSILVSNDGSSWEVPSGLTNPLISSPPVGYNADTDIVYSDDTDELWIYFLRHWVDTGLVKLTLMRSSDGIDWSEPEYLMTWDVNLVDNERSYTIVKRGSEWYYWAECFDADHYIYYRHSTDGRDWSEAQDVMFSSAPSDMPWHLDVIYVPTKLEYWMLFTAPASTGSGLYFAKSTDRLNWTLYTNKVLSPSNFGWDDGQIYRPTLLYHSSSNLLEVWYSARDVFFEWHIGYTQTPY